MSLRKVEIIVSSQRSGSEFYKANSYPHRDRDRNNEPDVYRVPVYFLYLKGENEHGMPITMTWKVLRFMPYWNDPTFPNPHYLTKGWTVAGLHELSYRKVTKYKRNYQVHSAHSIYEGAIVLKKSFYIHAGPSQIPDAPEGTYGSAGCIEVIGNFYDFKKNIKELSGSSLDNVDDAIEELVSNGLLYVQIDYATPPNLSDNLITH